MAQVIPIFKAGNANEFGNYRPIIVNLVLFLAECPKGQYLGHFYS